MGTGSVRSSGELAAKMYVREWSLAVLVTFLCTRVLASSGERDCVWNVDVHGGEWGGDCELVGMLQLCEVLHVHIAAFDHIAKGEERTI